MMTTDTVRLPAAMVIALALALAGCGKEGPDVVPVTGMVLIDEKPLIEGVISFVSTSGYAASTPLDDKGWFQLSSQYGPGMPPGTYRVVVLPPPSDPTLAPMRPGQSTPPSTIPAKYQHVDQSGLSVTVSEDASDFVFELESDE